MTYKPFWEHPSYLEKQKKLEREIAGASELLKRVADAIRNNHDTIAGHKDGPDGWVYYVDDARDAIRAVASWLDQEEAGDIDSIKVKLRDALRVEN